MFRFLTSDPKILRNTFTAIATIVDEGTFNIGPEGISLRSMDPSRVAMVDFMMPGTVFDEYVSTEATSICCDIEDLLKLVKRAGPDESVEVLLDERTARLKLVIRGKFTRTFNMPLLEAAEEEVPTPKILFNSKVTLTTDGLQQTLEDVVLVADHVVIEAGQQGVLMNAKGDLMSAKIQLDQGSDLLLGVEVKE